MHVDAFLMHGEAKGNQKEYFISKKENISISIQKNQEGKFMKDKIFGVLQRVGRSFMLPIAILPVAGLLLGVGGSFTNETMLETYGLMGIMGPGTVLNAILRVMSAAGDIVFANLPIIFAMGVAIGMAKKEKEVAALSAAIAFFIMHASLGAMIVNHGGTEAMLEGATTSVVGITSLQMGVFGGIIVGLGVSIYGSGNFDVFYLAGDSAGNLCRRQCGTAVRVCGHVDLWFDGTGIDSVWPASCILSPILADCFGRYDGSGRTYGRRGTEYLFCTAGRSFRGTFCGICHQIHDGEIPSDDFRPSGSGIGYV